MEIWTKRLRKNHEKISTFLEFRSGQHYDNQRRRHFLEVYIGICQGSLERKNQQDLVMQIRGQFSL